MFSMINPILITCKNKCKLEVGENLKTYIFNECPFSSFLLIPLIIISLIITIIIIIVYLQKIITGVPCDHGSTVLPASTLLICLSEASAHAHTTLCLASCAYWHGEIKSYSHTTSLMVRFHLLSLILPYVLPVAHIGMVRLNLPHSW